MNNFWNNIFRYPRFFISSLTGLVLVILTPFKSLFKIKRLRIFLVLFIFAICITLYIIIKNMLVL